MNVLMIFSKKLIIELIFTAHNKPKGMPINVPTIPATPPVITKERPIPLLEAPRLFNIAISFLFSITSITRAEDTFTEATKTIKNIKTNK